MRHLLLSAVVSGALPVAPAFAVPPPLPVNARYGPVVQCLNGYQVAVTAAEGLSLGADVIVINDRYLLRLRSGSIDLGGGAWAGVVHPELGPIERLAGRRDGPRLSVAYRLPAVGADPPVTVTSPQFTGGADDFAKLARVKKVDPSADVCGAFGPPNFVGQDFGALRWSPVLTPGPAYRCQNGIGYRVNPGERLRLSWGPEPDNGISELYEAGRTFGIRGPIEAAAKAGRSRGLLAAGYVVTSRPIREDASELILSPPNNDADRPFLRQVFIQHLNVHEAAARAIATRLELVSAKDDRCGKAKSQR